MAIVKSIIRLPARIRGLTSERQVLLISARLNAPSIEHLLKSTGSGTILVSQRNHEVVAEMGEGIADVVIVESYTSFVQPSPSAFQSSLNGKRVGIPRDQASQLDVTEVDGANRDPDILILHSSGTTGLPKPIFLTHRYLLGYAACHQFAPGQTIDWINLSTLPMYHGFGLLAPCLSLSVGMTCCFPPSSIIPAAHSTLEIARLVGARSLMTVPSIIDSIIRLPEQERGPAYALLSTFEFIAVGGGPLNPESGSALVKHGAKLLNHYGVTEIGAIAPIFCPGPDYNWRYLRLRSDLGLELRPIENSTRFRLVGLSGGRDEPFEVQDEIERRPDSEHVEVRIIGRVDDVIVLKTGEKVMPRLLEERLAADAAVQTAVCIGQGRFEVAVLIEPSSEAPRDPELLRERVWDLVKKINAELDQHGQVSSKKAIIIKPTGKNIPRSDKGSVMRREVHELFKEEIESAYAAMESATPSDAFTLDLMDIETGLRSMLAAVADHKLHVQALGSNEDFFEHGMDSLQSVRLVRLLTSALGTLGKQADLTVEFIYQHPSIKRLVGAVERLIHIEKPTPFTDPLDLVDDMRNLAEEYVATVSRKHTVLLTGATGNLGAHVLARLVRSSSVEKVICLGHSSRAASTDNSDPRPQLGSHTRLIERQRDALLAANILLDSEECAKIKLLDADEVFDRHDGNRVSIGDQLLQLGLAGRITHIVHLAWPMDFQRTLQSFRPHLDMVRAFIKLMQQAHVARPGLRVRLLFASSIAVVRHYKEHGFSTGGSRGSSYRVMVPETAMEDPKVVTPMGYAEAKWVCERMLERAGVDFGQELDPVIVRIGQLSGPETTAGTWKTSEHVPALVRASQMVGAFPQLEGVSKLPGITTLYQRVKLQGCGSVGT
jgi:acyl-CoA synthetase (AMP-forming)/AMP-acid ligase II/nucleoside-diphosphate-sugar epimerase